MPPPAWRLHSRAPAAASTMPGSALGKAARPRAGARTACRLARWQPGRVGSCAGSELVGLWDGAIVSRTHVRGDIMLVISLGLRRKRARGAAARGGRGSGAGN